MHVRKYVGIVRLHGHMCVYVCVVCVHMSCMRVGVHALVYAPAIKTTDVYLCLLMCTDNVHL